mgnify:CR=1 FL=1
MSNLLGKHKAKRRKQLERIQKQQRAIARHQATQEALGQYMNSIPVISNWCDNGETKPKCNHCPVCLNLKDGQNQVQVEVRNSKNELSKTFNLPDAIASQVVQGFLDPSTLEIKPVSANA